MVSAINNINVVRLQLDSANNTYFLPYATSFEHKPIRRIIPLHYGSVSDVAGVNTASIDSMYITLRDMNDNYIVRDFPLNLLSNLAFNDLMPLNTIIKWETAFVRTRLPLTDGDLLMLYMVYDEYRPILPEYSCIKTIEIPAGFTGKLSELLNVADYGYLKRITATVYPDDQNHTSDVFLTLNCLSGRTLNSLSVALMQQLSHAMYIPSRKGLYIADMSLDWDNSFITGNTTPGVTTYINLYFGHKL